MVQDVVVVSWEPWLSSPELFVTSLAPGVIFEQERRVSTCSRRLGRRERADTIKAARITCCSDQIQGKGPGNKEYMSILPPQLNNLTQRNGKIVTRV